MRKPETYSTLHEIRLRKETILSEIRMNNQQINILWKDMFRKPEPKKKSLVALIHHDNGNWHGRRFLTNMEIIPKIQEEIT